MKSSIPVEDALAADYIVSLWGKNRRQFARFYWLSLTRGMTRPPFSMCFGADKIARKLEEITGVDVPEYRSDDAGTLIALEPMLDDPCNCRIPPKEPS